MISKSSISLFQVCHDILLINELDGMGELKFTLMPSTSLGYVVIFLRIEII
jgi:hypothetical protein